MSAHAAARPDLSLFVLGVLSPEDSAAIEEHLSEGCEECRAEIEHWHAVAAMLSYGLDVEPPAELRRALVSPGAGAKSARGGGAGTARKTRSPLLGRLLAALAVLLLGYSAMREVGLRSSLEEQERLLGELRAALSQAAASGAEGSAELETLRRQAAERDAEVAVLRQELALAAPVAEFVGERDIEAVPLRSPERGKPARGHLLLAAERGRFAVHAFDLPPLPTDSVYEVWWLLEGGAEVRGGRLAMAAGGVGRLVGDLPATDAGRPQRLTLRLESVLAGEAPEGPVVLQGTLAGPAAPAP